MTEMTENAQDVPRSGRRRRGGRAGNPATGAMGKQPTIGVPLPVHGQLQALQRRLCIARNRWVTLGETIGDLIELAGPAVDKLIGDLEDQARAAAELAENRERM